MKVGIIDYGVGNLGSVVRALEEIRVPHELISTAAGVKYADCLILPGVGNFSDCARLLTQSEWIPAILEAVRNDDKPLLGICVGMQLLATRGMESIGNLEGGTPGLDLIPGTVEHLGSLGCTLRIPHVGWNSISAVPKKRPILSGIPDGTDFYFVHSFAFVADDPADVVATVNYGVGVAAVVSRGRVTGTQFHPEKSSRAGLKILRNFIENAAC